MIVNGALLEEEEVVVVEEIVAEEGVPTLRPDACHRCHRVAVLVPLSAAAAEVVGQKLADS